MFAKIVSWYNAKNRRERMMLWCVAIAVALIWASSTTKSLSVLGGEATALERQINLAQTAIAQGPAIRRELDEMLKTFDSSKTLSSDALQIAVEKRAKASELSYSISGATTKDAGRFKINTITLSCQRGALKNIVSFEKAMRELEPYAMFSRASFDGGNNGDVAAKYEISSFEL